MADSTTLIRDAVDNFEKLDLLIRKIGKFVQIGFLSEAQSKIVLGIYVSQRVIDEVTSFLGFTDLKNVAFRECIQALPFIFVPLKLESLL